MFAYGWPSGHESSKNASSWPSWSGKSSAVAAPYDRRSADAVTGSVPGARPMPRSMRPGCSASSMPNCSTTASGAWLGSMSPPEPTRIVDVASARCASRTAGDELAMPGMLWCSATQWRWYPRRSTSRASSTELRNACAGDDPRPTGARSRTDRGTGRGRVSSLDDPAQHFRELGGARDEGRVAAVDHDR